MPLRSHVRRRRCTPKEGAAGTGAAGAVDLTAEAGEAAASMEVVGALTSAAGVEAARDLLVAEVVHARSVEAEEHVRSAVEAEAIGAAPHRVHTAAAVPLAGLAAARTADRTATQGVQAARQRTTAEDIQPGVEGINHPGFRVAEELARGLAASP